MGREGADLKWHKEPKPGPHRYLWSCRKAEMEPPSLSFRNTFRFIYLFFKERICQSVRTLVSDERRQLIIEGALA